MSGSQKKETAREKKMRQNNQTPDDRLKEKFEKQKNRVVSLPLNRVRVEIGDADLPATFILPNKYTFHTLDYVIKDNVVEFTGLRERDYNEVVGRITPTDYRNPNYHKDDSNVFLSKKEYAKNLTRTTKWSNHEDFQPNLRLQIRPDIELLTAFNASDINMIETEGQIFRFKNFVFCPVNYLYCRFSRNSTRRVDFDLYARALASVSSQEMTCEQMAQMASNLSVLMLMYIKVKNDIRHKLALFAHCFAANIRVLAQNRNLKFSTADVYHALEDQEYVIIPTEMFDKGAKNLPKPGLEMALAELEVNNYIDDLPRISELIKFPDAQHMTKQEAIKAYSEGIAMFNNKCEPLILNYRRRYAPIRFNTLSDEDDFFHTVGPEEADVLKAIHYLVEDRMQETNLADSLRRMLMYADRYCCDQAFWEIYDRLIRFRVESFFHPGLNRLYLKKGEKVGVPVFEDHQKHEMVSFINDKLKLEKDICQTAQAECLAWCKFFHMYRDSCTFNNAKYILEFARSRRNTVTLTMAEGDDDVPILGGDAPGPSGENPQQEPPTQESPRQEQSAYDDPDEETTASELGWLGRMYSRVATGVKAPFVMGKNFISNVSTLATSAQNISVDIAGMRNEVAGAFEARNMRQTAQMFRDMDFSSISSSLNTVKMWLNAWFNDFVAKVCELFGVEYENRIDATTLLFYYLIWIKNDSKVVRWMIVMDIMVTIGIADAVWYLIKKISGKFFSMFQNPDNCGAFEDALGDLDKSIEDKKKTNADQYQQEEKKLKAEEKGQELEEGSEDWISWFMMHITNLTPEMMGAAAIVLLGYFSYQTRDDSKTVGQQITTMMRSVGFIGLGLAALPRIFGQVVAIINWVIDFAKSKFCSNHKREITIQEEMRDWLKKTLYIPGITEKILVRNLDACFEFNLNVAKMRELQEQSHRVDNIELRREFNERCKVVSALYPTVDSAIRLTLGSHEPFHVQFWSNDCGVGKTDAAVNLFQVFHQTLEEEEAFLRKKLGLSETDWRKFPAVYPYNENLKHDDMYYDQEFLYKDEDLVMKQIDPVSLATTMMMLSGFPCLSQQASLNSKGRLFNTKVMISNTNNAYLSPDGMLKPKALLRRRHLFKVEVKDEFKDGTALSSAKIEAAGINRTRGEHLWFTYMDSEENKEIAPFIRMDIKQLRELLPRLFKQQYQIEEHRLFNRNPEKSVLRVKYDAMKAKMEDYFGMSKNRSVDDVMKFLNEITEANFEAKIFARRHKVTDGTTSKEIDPKKVREGMKKIAQDYINVEKHINPDEDDLVKKFAKPDETAGQFVYRAIVNHDNRLFLVESEKAFMADPILQIDLNTIKWSSQEKRVFADVDHQLSLPELSTYLYHMCKLDVAYDKKDFEKIKLILQKEINNNKKEIAWRERFANLHNSTRRAIGSIALWIKHNAIQTLGKSIFQGFALAVGAIAMFASVAAIGAILAPSPTNTGYNSKDNRRAHGFGIPIGTAYLENTEPEIELGKRASYRVYVTKDKQTAKGMMIGIKGSIFLANKHLFGDCKSKGEWTLRIYDHLLGTEDRTEAIKNYHVDASRISEIPNADAVLINVDGFRPTRDVLHHFVTENDMKDKMINFRHCTYSMLALREMGPATIEADYKDAKRQFFRTQYMDGAPITNYRGDPYHDRVVQMIMRDQIIKGDSGSLIMHTNVKIQGKFIGIQLSVIDGANMAYCGIVTQEMLYKALEKFPDRALIQTTQKEGVLLTSDNELHDVFKYKSELYEAPIANQGISRTLGFKKTSMHGMFPNVGEPAIQHSGDKRIIPGSRHFLKVSLNKSNGTHEPDITVAEEKFMMKFLKRSFTKYVPGLNGVITLSTKDAIIGLRSPGYNSLDTKGSAGLPYKLERGANGKSPWIHYNEETKSWNIQQRVYDDVKLYEEIYRNNRVPYNFKGEFRKKEIVPLQKIYEPEKVKTRTVGQGNMIHLIVSDKILKDFYVTCKNTWNYGMSMPYALGIDSERHTNQMVQHLKYTDYVMDFDVKDWDSKMSLRLMNIAHEVKVQLIEEAYRSRNETPPPDMRNILFGMAVDFVDTEVIFEDIMYRKKGGLLSGYPGTLMINSEVHEMLKGLIAYRILQTEAPMYANAEFIHENVRTIQAADDTIIAVSPKLRHYLTPEAYREGYKKLGFEITAADKTDLITAGPIETTQFLKHSFKKVESGIWYGVPNESIVYGLLSWMRDDTKLTLEEQFNTNIYNALRFAWWRGKDFYERIRATINGHRERRAEWIFDYEDMGKQIGYAIEQANLDSLSSIPVVTSDFETHEEPQEYTPMFEKVDISMPRMELKGIECLDNQALIADKDKIFSGARTYRYPYNAPILHGDKTVVLEDEDFSNAAVLKTQLLKADKIIFAAYEKMLQKKDEEPAQFSEKERLAFWRRCLPFNTRGKPECEASPHKMD